MLYVGVDHHKRTSYLTMMDAGGRIVKQANLANTQDAVTAFFAASSDPISAVVEAGPNWPVMYDWLEALGQQVTLAHPAKVRVIAEAKVKTDRLDSRILAHLLRADLIPAAYVPGAVTREQRRQLRQRVFLVHLASAVKNRIHALVDRHPAVCQTLGAVSDLFGTAGRRWLQTVELPVRERALLTQDLTVLDALATQIRLNDQWVRQVAREDGRAQLLLTLPGIGDFFAGLIAVEIDDVTRFARPEKLAAYAGLVPSTYASGKYVHHGRITRQGNKWLRWACIEAVYPAMRQDAELRALYERIKAAKGANVAKVAVARRLLTICYRVLTERRPYRPATLSSSRLP